MNTHIYDLHPELGEKSHLDQLHKHRAQFHRSDIIKEPLYVISPIFNPQRFRSRWKNYSPFEKHVLDSGGKLVLIECSFGERAEVYVETLSENHTIIHVSTTQEIWLKENLINLAIQRLPKDWKYVAWVDADIQFTRPDWVGETIHQLQSYKVVQMFSIALDMTPDYHPYQINYGFIHDHINGIPDKIKGHKWDCYYEVHEGPEAGVKKHRRHPGFAWAATKEAISQLGGLIDFAILGSADHHMARALVGEVEKSVHPRMSKEYRDLLKIWQERADRYIKRNVGYVQGTINHFYHGPKVNRKYVDRWKILVSNQYAPSTDIKREWNGTWQLSENKLELRDQIKAYFKQRNEDNISMEGAKSFLD